MSTPWDLGDLEKDENKQHEHAAFCVKGYFLPFVLDLDMSWILEESII
jgi:hypothetical protein